MSNYMTVKRYFSIFIRLIKQICKYNPILRLYKKIKKNMEEALASLINE